MRILDIILEASNNVVIIGDSIAVGIGGGEPYAKGGINCTETLRRVNAFIASGKAKGATVILSSGASNSAPIELEGGIRKPGNGGLGAVPQQLKALKDAGATVALVGTGSNKSKPQPGTSWTGGKKYVVDLTGINQQLESMASVSGATFLGPLENFDPAMHSGKGDGIHPYGGYAKLKQAGMAVKPAQAIVPQSAQQAEPKQNANTQLSIAVPQGRVGIAVADIQRALLALGYKLPRHGVDGVRGPETSGAVKQFQRDNGLEVDGDPGPETVGALNKLIASKGIKFEKSTQADVKGKLGGVTDVDDSDIEDYGNIPKDQLTEKARKSADEYLGRPMSDSEWDWLVRATSAESAYNVKSYAMVMASILNRARDYGKNGVIGALKARNQFQAVTGTRADGHKPSANFVRGPNARQLHGICTGAIKYLPSVSRNQRNFSATNPAAYGPGTDIGWLHKLQKQGGQQIAGSHFNTTLSA
jgi:peptidoglycan hydrolase-like protein with peptidoglycan-binding domain